MANKKFSQLNNQALGLAFAVFGFLWWIAGLFWHGMMGQPTAMGMMYRSFSFLNPMHSVAVLVLFVVAGYVSGEIIARLYNWFLTR
ncbi:MAG: hypothetical protein HY512_00860 [Candidatus Aenigmarchaeota archaeon]|nr:hypothetical protein [Candidatus Aenigmarchaeota archaeon]